MRLDKRDFKIVVKSQLRRALTDSNERRIRRAELRVANGQIARKTHG